MQKRNHIVNVRAKQWLASSSALLLAVSISAHAQLADMTNADSRYTAGNTATSPTVQTGLPLLSNKHAELPIQRGLVPRPKSLPQPISAFQNYVKAVVGAELPVFGSSLFHDFPDTFTPMHGIQVNQDYVIGTDDELQIRGWGMVDIDVNATVDRSGSIYIPRVGVVKVAGIKYRDLQGYLKKAVSKFYSGFELTVSISQTRSVQVYVVGHAVRPGTYTLNAMSTLLNALFVSGGPDSTGTMRGIQVKRGNDTVTTFDLYDMLLNGDKSRDVGLQDGDIIYIPESGPMVAITGNIRTPGIFEIKGSATLANIVAWSGGFDSATEMKQVVVEKNQNNRYQVVAEMIADKNLLSERLASMPLNPGDVVRVFSPGATPVQAQIQDEYVQVSGEVTQSGLFKLRKNETLRELMARLGGVNDKAYLYAMSLKRESVRRDQQERLNQIADRFERELESSAAQRLSGSADKENATVIANEIERKRRLAQQMRNVKAEGRIVLGLEASNTELKNLPDIALQDGDTIYVPRMPSTVSVLGSVFQQNTYIHKPYYSVGDYLALAGGPTESADESEIYLVRADGTAKSARSSGWINGINGTKVFPGDTVVVPEKIERSTFRQSFKEWTTILYQFGLGAAGLKVLQN